MAAAGVIAPRATHVATRAWVTGGTHIASRRGRLNGSPWTAATRGANRIASGIDEGVGGTVRATVETGARRLSYPVARDVAGTSSPDSLREMTVTVAGPVATLADRVKGCRQCARGD